FAGTPESEEAFAAILALSPQGEPQRVVKERAIQISSDMAQVRLLLFTQADNSLPVPFLAMLVFWLAVIFAGFSLFSRINPSLIVALVIFALSVSRAMFLILELNQPFAGLLPISRTTRRNVSAPL